eukprot:g46686.t1
MGICLPKQGDHLTYSEMATSSDPERVSFLVLAHGNLVTLHNSATNKRLRVVPGSKGAKVDGYGGPGLSSSWRVLHAFGSPSYNSETPAFPRKVPPASLMLVNQESLTYLRVLPDGSVDALGHGGALCLFTPECHRPNLFSFKRMPPPQLFSFKINGNHGYLGCLNDGRPTNTHEASSGPHGQFVVELSRDDDKSFAEGVRGEHEDALLTLALPAPTPLPNLPVLANGATVLLRSHAARCVRVAPNSDGRQLDANAEGAAAALARWTIAHVATAAGTPNCLMLHNKATKGFLRIHPNGTVDAQGQGGLLCQLEVVCHRPGVFGFYRRAAGRLGFNKQGQHQNAKSVSDGDDGCFSLELLESAAVVSHPDGKQQAAAQPKQATEPEPSLAGNMSWTISPVAAAVPAALSLFTPKKAAREQQPVQPATADIAITVTAPSSSQPEPAAPVTAAAPSATAPVTAAAQSQQEITAAPSTATAASEEEKEMEKEEEVQKEEEVEKEEEAEKEEEVQKEEEEVEKEEEEVQKEEEEVEKEEEARAQHDNDTAERAQEAVQEAVTVVAKEEEEQAPVVAKEEEQPVVAKEEEQAPADPANIAALKTEASLDVDLDVDATADETLNSSVSVTRLTETLNSTVNDSADVNATADMDEEDEEATAAQEKENMMEQENTQDKENTPQKENRHESGVTEEDSEAVHESASNSNKSKGKKNSRKKHKNKKKSDRQW